MVSTPRRPPAQRSRVQGSRTEGSRGQGSRKQGQRILGSQGKGPRGRAETSRQSKVAGDRAPQIPFSKASLQFLRSLARNNRREWFEPRKAEFERELKSPMLALIAEINQALTGFAPAHVRPPQKIMMRIYRDTRFSTDKRPYKHQVAAWWSREGLEKTSGGGFYFHLSGREVVIAAGVYMPQREQLLKIRRYLLDRHSEVRALLDDKKLRRSMETFEGMPLSRPPKGFPKEHPAMDLLCCRQWGVTASLPPETALEPGFAREVIRRFRLAAPLVEALNTPLIASFPMKRPLLFALP